jgi:hypothetical protein
VPAQRLVEPATDVPRHDAVDDRARRRVWLRSPARHSPRNGTGYRRFRKKAGAGRTSSSSRRRGVGRTVV